MASFSLQGDFVSASHEDWLGQVERVLKGRSADILATRRIDEIHIAPVYDGHAAHSSQPVFARKNPWTVMQRTDDPDPDRGNHQVLRDLEGGAGGLALVFARSGSARGAGISSDADSLARLLDGVHPHMLHLRVEGNSEDLGNVLTYLGSADERLDVSWCPDPLALIENFTFPVQLIADGRVWHEAGATDIQELGFALAQGLELLRGLEAASQPLNKAAGHIEFMITANADIMGSIAKLRAMRLLWLRLLEAAEISNPHIRIHAETSWRMMAARDVHTNMLRTSAAGLAAAAGGADSITVLPFTMALGLPDSFARRVARNSQIILLEESGLALVNDPAAGSGAAEDMTQQIAAKAWEVFQDIQRSGGLKAAVDSGKVSSDIAASASKLAVVIATRKFGITGISEYPDLGEKPTETLPFDYNPAPVSSLPRTRLAEPYEALRDRADALTEAGRTPKVFMINLGKGYAARNTWAANLLASGGIVASGQDTYDSAQSAAEAFSASDLKIACICGDDETYAAIGTETVNALKDAGATLVCLAGRPKEATGADQLIYQGCDATNVLSIILDGEDA